MEKVQNFGDNRNKGYCVHCGGPNETRDHCPSKVFLDEPYPGDLPASPSCAACNNGFSADEAYLACLIESVMAGAANPDIIGRAKVAKLLRGNSALAAIITNCRRETTDGIMFDPDAARVQRVVIKLARGHAAFEINEPQLSEPDIVTIKPLSVMSEEERADFEGDGPQAFMAWPEVGSRAINRLLIVDRMPVLPGWLHVQDQRYRYWVGQGEGVIVRIVIREYFACEVVWC